MYLFTQMDLKIKHRRESFDLFSHVHKETLSLRLQSPKRWANIQNTTETVEM